MAAHEWPPRSSTCAIRWSQRPSSTARTPTGPSTTACSTTSGAARARAGGPASPSRCRCSACWSSPSAWTLYKGIGVWGNNIPVGWAFGIINFVWWIGIGHAGTLISAILLLFQQKWRTSINRFAEAMTLFAVMCALLFPLLHTGRPWFAAYWLLPYPSIQGIWPQFKSPLIWDVFAVSTYFTVSLLFWFLGLIPDLAALRDSSRSKTAAPRLRHVRAWAGAARAGTGPSTSGPTCCWPASRRRWCSRCTRSCPSTSPPRSCPAGTPRSSRPTSSPAPSSPASRWCMTWMIPARQFLGLKHVVTMQHLENMNKVMLATGMMVTYGYVMEHFIAWYSGNPYEFAQFFSGRASAGPYRADLLADVFCNCVVPQIFWFKKVRTSILVIWFASILINVGMWCERFIIIVTSLHRDFLPSAGRTTRRPGSTSASSSAPSASSRRCSCCS